MNSKEYTLKVTNPSMLKKALKDRYNQFVCEDGKPNMELIDLLCNGDKLVKKRLRVAVEIVPA